jgi:hypothetical protein
LALARKIILSADHEITALSSERWEAGDLLEKNLLLSISHLMQPLSAPRFGRGFLSAIGQSQIVQMLAPMIEIEQLPGMSPSILHQIPNSLSAIG